MLQNLAKGIIDGLKLEKDESELVAIACIYELFAVGKYKASPYIEYVLNTR